MNLEVNYLFRGGERVLEGEEGERREEKEREGRREGEKERRGRG